MVEGSSLGGVSALDDDELVISDAVQSEQPRLLILGGLVARNRILECREFDYDVPLEVQRAFEVRVFATPGKYLAVEFRDDVRDEVGIPLVLHRVVDS